MIPYIGVTGFTGHDEVEDALHAFPLKSNRRLMVGVLASSKSIRGLEVSSYWEKRFPRVPFSTLFLPDIRALNLVHYHCGNGHENDLLAHMREMDILMGHHGHGFQLNVPWPSRDQLEKYQHEDRRGYIVLQIGNVAIEKAGEKPERIAKKVVEYIGLVDAVLLDQSGGKGEVFDPLKTREYLREIKSRCPKLGLGAAGGLGPNTLAHLIPLIEEFPDLSIDAEGRLRTPENDIDKEAVSLYLTRASQFLAPVPSR